MKKITLIIILFSLGIGLPVNSAAQSRLYLFGNIICENNVAKRPIHLEIFGLNYDLPVEVVSNPEGTAYAVTVARPSYNLLSLMFRIKGNDESTAYYNIPLTSADTVRCDVSFLPVEKTLGEVIVQGESAKKVQNQRFMRDVEGSMIFAGKKTNVAITENMLLNKAANNTRQLFRTISGITIHEGSEGGLQLNIGARGLNPNRSANFNMRQNGYDISADPLGYPESYYTPNADDIKEIQVFRGASALQYGSQFGGMVNFRLAEAPQHRRWDIRQHLSYGSYGFMSSYTRLSGTSGRLAYYASATFKQGDGYRPNSDFKSYSLLGQLTYQLGTFESVHLDWLKYHYLEHQPGGLTDVMFHQDPFQSNRERNWFLIDWNIISLRYRKAFNSNHDELNFHATGLYANRFAIGYRNKRVGTPDPGNTERDLQRGIFRNWSVETRYMHRFHLPMTDIASSLVVGGKYYQGRNSGEQGPGSSGKDADFTMVERTTDVLALDGKVRLHSFYRYPNLNFALFSEASLRLGERWTIVPGIRAEVIRTGIEGELSHLSIDYTQTKPTMRNDKTTDNTRHNRTIWLAGMAAACKLTKAELYANVTRNYRAITFNDMRTVSPGLAVNPNLKDETGYSCDIGTRSRGTSGLTYDVSTFFLYYGDRIGEYYRENPDYPGTFHRYRDNIGNAVSYGVEGSGTADLSFITRHLHPDFQAQCFANAAITGSRYLDSKGGYNSKGHQIEFVPLYNIKGGVNLSFKRLDASLQASYMSFQYTDATNEPMDPNDAVYGIYGAIPGYCVVDCTLGYRLTDYARMNLSLQNIGNQIYMTRRATGYPGPGIIPSAPFNVMFTLQLHF